MKASELRIGNLIMDLSGFVGSVAQIGEDQTVKITNKKGVLLDWMRADLFKPIPLTEEWLIKFGFEELTPKYYVLNIDENISFAYYYTYSGGVWHFEFEGIPIKIEYINQLQNIYFALTGNELEIKE